MVIWHVGKDIAVIATAFHAFFYYDVLTKR